MLPSLSADSGRAAEELDGLCRLCQGTAQTVEGGRTSQKGSRESCSAAQNMKANPAFRVGTCLQTSEEHEF